MSDSATEQAQALADVMGMMIKSTRQKLRSGEIAQAKELGVKWDETATEIKLPGQPDPMTVEEGIQTLLDFKAKEDQLFEVSEYLPGMPHDAAHAFVKVMERRYGWVNPQTIKTMFGDIQPEMVMVRTGPKPKDYVEVPVGKFKLQDTKAELITGFARNPKAKEGSFLSFHVSAKVRHHERKIIMALIEETRDYLREHSIYKGKAMRLPVGSDGKVEASVAPSFIDLSKVSEDGLVLTQVNYSLMEHTVWTPIRKTAIARKHGVSLKRGALLYGPYGTGKTLTALVTAKIAQDNGWTFIMVDKVEGLDRALELAKLYQPSVVFAEDVERVAVKSRDNKTNDLLNTIDGAVSKDGEIITVLTTNHIELINEAMLRPGRLDALIHVTKPDAEAAERLVRLYAGNLLDKSVPLTALGKLVEENGYIPAIIAEIVSRAKLGMIFREETQIVEDDLLVAAYQMVDHSKLLQQKKPEPSPEEAFGLAAKRLLGDPQSSYSGDLGEDLNVIRNRANSAKDYAEAAYELSEKHLPKIKKLLEEFAVKGAPNGSGDLVRKIDAIADRVGARVTS